MTRVDISPEQRDAEAAGTRNLAQAIALHRALAAAERYLPRLHQRDGEFGIGLPFSHPFERFLDGSFGPTFAWSSGLRTLSRDCDQRHTEHPATFCASLVTLVIRDAYAFDRASWVLGVTPERTERVLLRALRRIEQRLDEIAARSDAADAADRGRHDWQAPAWVHRPLPGLHAVECRQCLRMAA